MYDAILNVGMAVEGGQMLAEDEVFAAMHNAGIIAHKAFAVVVESDSEPTLIFHAVVDRDSDILEAAEALQQDCIAVWRCLAKEGALIGPNAAKWGAFNPAHFFLPSGKRLTEI